MQTFSTRDLGFAAFLVTKGKEVVGIEVSPNRRVFIKFAGSYDEMQELLKAYMNDEPVGAKSIISAYLNLRSMVISAAQGVERARRRQQGKGGDEEDELFS